MFCRGPFTLFLLIAIAALSGCENGSVNSSQRRPGASAAMGNPSFSNLEQQVAASAVRIWHQTDAQSNQTYELDPYDRRMSRQFRQALSDICPPLPASADQSAPSLLTISVEKINFPQGDFAYAVLRVGNRYGTAKHAYVFRETAGKLELLDHYLIAEGLMHAALIDFSWAAYCREKRIEDVSRP